MRNHTKPFRRSHRWVASPELMPRNHFQIPCARSRIVSDPNTIARIVAVCWLSGRWCPRRPSQPPMECSANNSTDDGPVAGPICPPADGDALGTNCDRNDRERMAMRSSISDVRHLHLRSWLCDRSTIAALIPISVTEGCHPVEPHSSAHAVPWPAPWCTRTRPDCCLTFRCDCWVFDRLHWRPWVMHFQIFMLVFFRFSFRFISFLFRFCFVFVCWQFNKRGQTQMMKSQQQNRNTSKEKERKREKEKKRKREK